METEEPQKKIRLIVNADDFGVSRSANLAIGRAHREGILTSASLMVTGSYADEAVAIARQLPQLGVGLHLVLVKGRSVLKGTELNGLVNPHQQFSDSPLGAGFSYFLSRGLRAPIRQEIDAQIKRFRLNGLPLDHVNSHLHFHLHPTVFDAIRRDYNKWGISSLRVPRDPLLTNLRLAWGRFFYRLAHAFIFSGLTRRTLGPLQRRGIRHTDLVFGMLQSGRMNEKFMLRLLENLFPGTFEVYLHPDEEEHSDELEALLSPAVKELVRQRGIELIRYQDL
jgi:hopanoid biosynthesis associated protein HpnK